MKKSTLIVAAAVVLIVVTSVLLISKYKKSHSGDSAGIIENTQVDLPINTLALSERPFITLTPDKTGHSLSISVSGAPKSGNMEYEMIYNASGKQEGALGSISLASATQPIVKDILLGSRSAGGATTYHEGVTGGSITLTYGETRLKESWNYLHFDPADPSVSSTDGRFSLTLPKTALKKDQVIVTMKTFGYDKTGLPEGASVKSGPYGYFSQTPVKVSGTVSLKLPAGTFTNPTLYEWNGTTWKKLATKLDKDAVTGAATGTVFLVTAD